MESGASYIAVTVIADNVGTQGLPRIETIAVADVLNVLEGNDAIPENRDAPRCRIELADEYPSPLPWVFRRDDEDEIRRVVTVASGQEEIKALVLEARSSSGIHTVERMREYRAWVEAGMPVEVDFGAIPRITMIKKKR